VLETGNPVRMPWADKVGAVVQAWYGGAKGGEAIARVLTGDVNPSGRLPITWPADESQLPRPAIPGWSAGPKDLVKVDYTIEGADVGYRWFARKGATPRYWFGHGLSYTTFDYANLTIRSGKELSASLDVTNTGSATGQDVVQLYLSRRPGGPARRLLAFSKVGLKPGETKRVTLTADPRLIADFDVAGRGWKIAGGRYEVGIGRDAGHLDEQTAVKLPAQKFRP